MSDAVFNSFLKSVYGSGTAMHHFDNHIEGGLEVVGGINDISVDSIFGGIHDHINSTNSDDVSSSESGDISEPDDVSEPDDISEPADVNEPDDVSEPADVNEPDDVSESDKPNCNCKCKGDCKCEDKKKTKAGNAPMVSGMNIDLNSCTTPNTLIGSISLPIASIEPQSKAIGSGHQGLTAHDVSSMIQNYR
jgi:hypothetical protein